MDRRVTPPRRVTSPTWGPPPPCTQALRPSPPELISHVLNLMPSSMTKYVFFSKGPLEAKLIQI